MRDHIYLINLVKKRLSEPLKCYVNTLETGNCCGTYPYSYYKYKQYDETVPQYFPGILKRLLQNF